MDFTQNNQFTKQFRSSQEVFGLMAEVVGDVDNIFQQIAPRRTGRLVRTATKAVTLGRDGWEAKYSLPAENPRDGAKYGKFVEFGTSRMRAQHNLQRTLQILQENNT